MFLFAAQGCANERVLALKVPGYKRSSDGPWSVVARHCLPAAGAAPTLL